MIYIHLSPSLPTYYLPTYLPTCQPTNQPSQPALNPQKYSSPYEYKTHQPHKTNKTQKSEVSAYIQRGDDDDDIRPRKADWIILDRGRQWGWDGIHRTSSHGRWNLLWMMVASWYTQASVSLASQLSKCTSTCESRKKKKSRKKKEKKSEAYLTLFILISRPPPLIPSFIYSI